MSAEQSIDRAVDEALDENMSPESFVKFAAECWAVRLYDRARMAADDFRKMLDGRRNG